VNTAQIIAKYDLQPLPGEGGYFRRFYTHSRQQPGSASRLASAIFFLITKDSFSALHRLPSDELFHFYEGHAAQMLQLDSAGGGQIVRFGPDQERAIVVPGGSWQGMRLADDASEDAFALFGVSVHPEFRDEEFELGTRAALCASHPQWRGEIERLTR
jgi:predicted cupin superfamily sugar epimerase